jgi:NADH-quinone oxidoreductase subunit E
MAVRRLAPAEVQPTSFAFTAENAVWAGQQIAKYPEGRQASAVIALLWKAQEQCGGWVPEAAIRAVADLLKMPYIRVLEVATFYTMFNLEPVGKYLVQLCGTTPCMLRGAEELKDVLRKRVGDQHHVSTDGNFSWVEVECLGACCNAPMVQINDDYFEDLTPESFDKLLDDLVAGRSVTPGPQNGRRSSEPEGDIKTLTDPALFDGSVVGAWKKRFEEEDAKARAAAEEKAKAEASAAQATAPASPEPAKPAETRSEQRSADSPADRVADGRAPISGEDATKAAPQSAPEQEERTRAKSPRTARAPKNTKTPDPDGTGKE